MIKKLIKLKVLLVLLLFSCNKEDTIIESGNFVWAPLIKIEKGDTEATLQLIDIRPVIQHSISHPLINPDYFEVLISENNNDFNFYKEVPLTTTELKIPNLENGKSYYFKVAGCKKNYQKQYSNSVMTIPSKRYESLIFLENIDFSINRVLLSKSESYITFQSNQLSPNSLYYRKIDDNKDILVEEKAGAPNWSPKSDKFIYTKNIDVGIYRHNSEFKIYDIEKSQSTSIMEIDYNNYSAYNPQFSPDGESIIFLSSEGNAEQYHFDIWTSNFVSKEKLTDFTNKNFSILDFNWVNNLDEVYLCGYYSGQQNYYNIYKLNLSDRILIPVIESNWDDEQPALSPDNNLLAFSSKRTGSSEIWIYNFLNKRYKQITGGTLSDFDSRYSNIQWISNNTILTTLYENKLSKVILIKLSD